MAVIAQYDGALVALKVSNSIPSAREQAEARSKMVQDFLSQGIRQRAHRQSVAS